MDAIQDKPSARQKKDQQSASDSDPVRQSSLGRHTNALYTAVTSIFRVCRTKKERMASSDRLRIGTSGWHYKHWRERFYPKGMPSIAYLEYYCQKYDTVELNGVFYRLPEPEAVKHW